MRLRVLGPVEILDDHGSALPTRRMARVLLGMLALHANAFVPADRIVDALWGERPPPSAPVNLRSYVSDLRRLLGTGPRIDTGNGGYRLTAGPNDLDVLAFTELAQRGHDCLGVGDHEQAAELLTTAIGLWRGPVLDGTPVPEAIQPAVRMLEDRRVDAVEDCFQARLELGETTGIAAELRQLVGQHELRERLWGQLMLALYRGGRPGEAVQAYERLRQVLAAELGTDPGPEIKALHHRILRDDPRLASPAPEIRSVPWQLPPGTDPFIGRDDQLRALDQLAGAAAVIAVVGTAAVGKTALTVRWAHGARERFPDGCLYVDLRGYGPEPPVSPEQVLASFLRVLGQDAIGSGLDTAELSGRYRTAIADRRMLVVLDNARAADQVRPLLPGTAGCLVLVTSRDDLAGLVARDGAHRVALNPMPPHEAQALLGKLVGDQEGVGALAERCAGLPLALRIVAELAAQSGTTLADLAVALADRQRGLDELDAGGDPRTAVTAVFDWSHQVLPPLAAKAFELLTWHPGTDFDVYAAAALLEITPAEAGRLVGQLCRAHLVQRGGSGRFQIHDLLRAYGRRLTAETTLTGLVDYYVHAAAIAETRASLGRGRAPQPSSITVPPLDDPVQAAHWLNAERANLVAVVTYCATHGLHAQTCELSEALRPYLNLGRHLAESLTICRHALHSARQLGEPSSIGAALNNLGGVFFHLGHYAEAIDHLDAALVIRKQLSDRVAEARTITSLGWVYTRLGRHDEAKDHYRQALLISREIGDQAGETVALSCLAFVHSRLGRHRDAVANHERSLALAAALGDRMLEEAELINIGLAYALLGRYRDSAVSLWRASAICRELGDREGEGFVSGNLAVLHTRLGNHWVAQRHVERSLAAHQESGDRASEAAVLGFSGDLLLRMNEPVQALRSFRRALTLARHLGERSHEGHALNGIAAAALAMCRFDEASEHLDEALAVTTAIGDAYGRARALAGFGHVRSADGDLVAALALWSEAAALFDEIGVPEGAELRAFLVVRPGFEPGTLCL